MDSGIKDRSGDSLGDVLVTGGIESVDSRGSCSSNPWWAVCVTDQPMTFCHSSVIASQLWHSADVIVVSRRARQDQYMKRESRGPSPRISPSLAMVLDVSGSRLGVASVAASGLTETASGGTGAVFDLLRNWFGDMPQAGCLGESCSPPSEACASAAMCAELAADWGLVGGVGIVGGVTKQPTRAP